MKIFKLNSVKYKNIMSVGAKYIDIDLSTHQRSLVTGKNGGGKSTILEAITFALFGKPFRNIKKNQLINSNNKKNLLVELMMEYDGHKFFIKRGLKPNIFEIERDGVKLDESASVKDFQEYFENLIGMNYSSFKQIAVLGTAGYTPFMALSTPARRKLIEDLLGVSTLAEMDRINKGQLREINSNIKIIDVKKENLTQQIKIYENNAEKQKRLSGDNIDRLQKMYNDLVDEAKSYKKQISVLTDSLTDISVPEIEDVESEINEEIFQAQRDIKQGKEIIKLYQVGGNCPTCRQSLVKNSSLIKSVEENNHSTEKTLQVLNARLKASRNAQRQVNAVIDKIHDIKTQINSNKQGLLNSVSKAKKINLLISEAKSEIIDYSNEIKKLESNLDEIIKEKTHAVMEKYHRGILTDMLKDSGIKGAIIKKYIPLFNKQINSYLKMMDADYVFTLDEEFNETIKSRGREDFSYASFSQGEKARIDIAILFTWKDIAERVSGVKISTLILDEVFDGPADSECIKNIGIILSNLKDTNTFVISHRDHDPQLYGQHIKMKKVGRFTVLE